MLEIETISERENGEYSGYINLYKGISYYHGVGIKKDIQKPLHTLGSQKGWGASCTLLFARAISQKQIYSD